MDYAAITRQIIKKVGPYVKAAIEKDASNRYSLKEEWRLPAVKFALPVGEYHGEVVNILSNGEWVIVWYNPFESTAERPICDGASLFPDKVFGVNLVPASIAHDTIYREWEAIAKAFGVKLSTIRKFADKVFASVNLAENDGKVGVKTISTLTYWGVRLFGGIYHRRKIATALFIVAFCMAGCAGCVGSVFDPEDDYSPPIYEKVSMTEVRHADGD